MNTNKHYKETITRNSNPTSRLGGHKNESGKNKFQEPPATTLYALR